MYGKFVGKYSSPMDRISLKYGGHFPSFQLPKAAGFQVKSLTSWWFDSTHESKNMCKLDQIGSSPHKMGPKNS